MPPKWTARRIFWIGVILALIRALVGIFGPDLLFRIWGMQSTAVDLWNIVGSPFLLVLGPLGCGLIAVSLVVKHLESSHLTTTDPGEVAERTAPPTMSSRQILGTGIILIVVGIVIMTSLNSWVYSFSGSKTIMSDILMYLGIPANILAVPLGVVLIPCSFIVRALESPSIRSIVQSRIRATTRERRKTRNQAL